MGVTVVIPWEVPEGKSGQQAVEILQQRTELLGAQKTGNWSVDCEAYHSVSTHMSSCKLLRLVHSTEFPLTSFCVLESGTCLVADSGFDSLMIRLKAFYAPRKSSVKIEAKGPRYEYGDFIIKFGQVSTGPNFKGVVIEIEYLPCFDVEQGWPLLKEFVTSSMVQPITLPPPPKVSSKATVLFSPADTIRQYVNIFNNYIKKTQAL